MLVEVEPKLAPAVYRLPDDPFGPCVLVPAFQAATSVRGAFGWFSAGWISRLAPGLADYINRDDTGTIAFTVAPVLWAPERAAAESAFGASIEDAATRVARLFTRGRTDASALEKHALDCLAWMLATARLQLRVAVPTRDANYHPKVWLFDDGTHQVLARGSGNATGRGIGAGVEHFDVDVTWVEHSAGRVRRYVSMLDDWNAGRSAGIARVVNLPEALEQNIIRTAPDNAPTPDGYIDAVRKDGNPPWAMDPLARLRSWPARPGFSFRPRLSIPAELEWQQGPYKHQGEAVAAWEGGPEPERGTIAMATGAGKTLTALICATRVQDRVGDAALLIVISAPSVPILIQWRDEVRRFGVTAITPSLQLDADKALTTLFRGLAGGGTHVAIVTNKMLCTRNFQATVELKTVAATPPFETLFIADEAHTLGAPGFLKQRPDFFTRRLALSATPERQYDPDGTEQIFEFFGPAVYEFGLGRAVGFCLCEYSYFVHPATLGGSELEEFLSLSQRIARWISRDPDAGNESKLRGLMIARRRLIETAAAKLTLLEAVLRRRGPRSLRHTLVYASAKDPSQFDRIAALLTTLNVRWAAVTQETTRNTGRLTRIFDAFVSGGYQVLLAKKVLDEGVDVPHIREAFIVASSNVEREWIQRRGRVLRRQANKPWAIVHDFLALPPVTALRDVTGSHLKKIVENELGRAFAFATYARNSTGHDGTVAWLARIRDAYWPKGSPSNLLHATTDSHIAPGTPTGTPW